MNHGQEAQRLAMKIVETLEPFSEHKHTLATFISDSLNLPQLLANSERLKTLEEYQLRMEGACHAGTATEKQILSHETEMLRARVRELEMQVTRMVWPDQ